MVTASVLFLLLSVVSPPVHSNITTFHVIPVHMTQSEAREACRENYTDLVTVYSDENNTELYHMTMKAGGEAGWIGLYRGQFSEKWSNGDPVTFSNLAGDCGTSSSCAVMKPDGSWESLQCTETKYFMCYEQGSIHVSAEVLSWEKALDYCNEENRAGILNIDSEAEQEEVESELRRRRVSAPLWVGLRQSRLFGLWIWTDGTVVSPNANWDGGKPPEGPLSQHCGAVVPPDYRWRDMNCRGRMLQALYSSLFTRRRRTHSSETSSGRPLTCGVQACAEDQIHAFIMTVQ
ncbi:macrophage mannose receptor 1-like [Clarias magur]|uniref:Macrophage mannose receptor 1-like n=1 Tax=Clarias magur TaxID=1594786 RepID=A0A8J4TGD0_CLAMG|nr:macrophage mannose receptor 1-like [Clarias magur]